ncbi:hypothetical protein CY34DRAFT_9882 [Suillus luteus UH-Slu-Lm8-n1]|uniref:Vacuolar sorting protein 39/Transforming growth factor beta receptor-associated domain-containing protein n=1 Tax=Suillus luteus UH-Slu-Lm8-n1 TaxID=930992 RepID=A0A0D0AWU9_9AGAM|nr:hypothetical protein CY34DRAFT_9882 [Suillus luteus UH-Slu-Lm8-n1]
MRHSSFPRSSILVYGKDTIHSLVQSTVIAQVESLLDNNQIEDAADLANNFASGQALDSDEAETLEYLHQTIAFTLFSQTRFVDAAPHFLAGALDPRILVSYFPELSRPLFTDGEEADMYDGIAKRMPIESSVDDLSEYSNLSNSPSHPSLPDYAPPPLSDTPAPNSPTPLPLRNYSPHLLPSTRDAPAAQEIHKILRDEAIVMIKSVLQGFKGQGQYKQQEVTDTALAILFARSGDTTSLISHLESTNSASLSAVEPVLLEAGEVGALCALLRARGDEGRVMEIWKGLVEGRYSDSSVLDPLSNMFALLESKQGRDRAMLRKWGVWLTVRDSERGLILLMSTKRSAKEKDREEDSAVLSELQQLHPGAARKFLEWLVIVRRRDDAELHAQFVQACVDELLECLQDESTSKLWRAKFASYTSQSSQKHALSPSSTQLQRPQSSFLTYFVSTTPDSPSKRARLKTLFALQALSGYDAEMVKSQIVASGFDKVLGLEVALLDGKMGMHRIALRSLALTLRDSVSAETYARTGGIVVPSKAVEACGMGEWGALFAAKGGPGVLEREKSLEGKGELVRMLLEVYMEDGEPQQTTRLLSSQAASLDTIDVSVFLFLQVIPLVPPDWPLSSLSPFLTHSFRRTLHAKHEGQIIKAMCAAQNSKVFENSYLVFQEQGAIIEEADDDDDGDGDGESESFNEKDGLAEKIALHLQDQQRSEVGVVDVLHPRVGSEEGVDVR